MERKLLMRALIKPFKSASYCAISIRNFREHNPDLQEVPNIQYRVVKGSITYNTQYIIHNIHNNQYNQFISIRIIDNKNEDYISSNDEDIDIGKINFQQFRSLVPGLSTFYDNI